MSSQEHEQAAYCPTCGRAVTQRLTPDGRRQRGRPRRYCDERCRTGDRRSRAATGTTGCLDGTDFAAAVRAAVARSGRSLREIESALTRWGELASSLATLSSWQNGSSKPPNTPVGRNRVLALERCLGLPVGQLALRLPGIPPPQPPRPMSQVAAHQRTTLDPLVTRHARLQHRVNTMTGSQQILPVSWRKDFVVGADHWPRQTRITLRLRAAHDDVDRYWFFHAFERRLAPQVAGVAGCEFVSEVRDGVSDRSGPGTMQVAASELRFDRVLARGEYYDFTFCVAYGARPAAPLLADQIFRHVQAQPCKRIDLALIFDPETPPLEVLQCHWHQRDLHETRQQAVQRKGWQYRLGVDDPLPGGYGWRWDWSSALDAVAGVGARGGRNGAGAA